MPEYLIAFNDEWVQEHTPEELQEKARTSTALTEEMMAAGVWVYGNGGIDVTTAICSVEPSGGEPVFTDGPYTETKEHLGGFFVIEVPDEATARYWAGRMAVCLDWPQEVHRFPGRPQLDEPATSTETN